MVVRVAVVLAALALLTAGCSAGSGPAAESTTPAERPLEPPPAVPEGSLSAEAREAVARLIVGLDYGLDAATIRAVGAAGDARLGWVVSDVLRLLQVGSEARGLVEAFERLTGVDVPDDELEQGPWRAVADRLLAWELPAPPDYAAYKSAVLLVVEPRWAPFFLDPEADVDWRLVSWGGVLIDDRPPGDARPCPQGCIPALDDPSVTGAAGGAWYPDDGLVFGVVVNGEARAYPKNVLEVHELVNDTLGGRRIGLPYCTLCGSAQAYFTDSADGGAVVLRTSGLLSRSNKIMYDLATMSILDTFTGRALSGPLREAGVRLEQVTVVTSTWGAWKQAHPDTTIVARDGGIGRSYPADPLRGRDDDGPIFPIGSVDPRLPVQEQVVGVVAADGTPFAFPADAARSALREGEAVELAGVRLELDGDGLRATDEAGEPLVSHQAFWFAWSQFHPGTAVWTRPG